MQDAVTASVKNTASPMKPYNITVCASEQRENHKYLLSCEAMSLIKVIQLRCTKFNGLKVVITSTIYLQAMHDNVFFKKLPNFKYFFIATLLFDIVSSVKRITIQHMVTMV